MNKEFDFTKIKIYETPRNDDIFNSYKVIYDNFYKLVSKVKEYNPEFKLKPSTKKDKKNLDRFDIRDLLDLGDDKIDKKLKPLIEKKIEYSKKRIWIEILFLKEKLDKVKDIIWSLEEDELEKKWINQTLEDNLNVIQDHLISLKDTIRINT